MILAEKITKLRKKNGWSQEELAEKMNVSRQSVSKWESAQAMPDIEKILQLSLLFDVTTDFLLKDEIETLEYTNEPSQPCVRTLGLEDAKTYLEQTKKGSIKLAIATFLCILSPIALIILSAASEIQGLGISETLAGVVGIVALFALVLCAVPLYIIYAFKNEPFAFLDKNVPFETEYGVKAMVLERQNEFKEIRIKWNVIAACICIFSPIPIIVSAFFENDLLCAVAVAVTMIIAGIGVAIFIIVGVRYASMQKLLKQGEYTDKEKSKSAVKEALGFAYFGILTAVYLGWSFALDSWGISWLVFAVGGVLFPVVMGICDLITDKTKK